MARTGTDAAAVYGTSSGSSGQTFGVFGTNSSNNVNSAGVRGDGISGTRGLSTVAANGSDPVVGNRIRAGGAYGTTSSSNGNAGYFLGRVVIDNSSAAGSPTAAQDALIIWTNGAGTGAAGFNSSGALFTPSDRNIKQDFATVDPVKVLDKLVATPITRWHYKNDLNTWYMGPMAQDFHQSFGLGDKETVIHGVNADGVAFAAIQGLNVKVENLRTEVRSRERRIEALEQRLLSLEAETLRGGPGAGNLLLIAFAAGGPVGAAYLFAMRRRRHGHGTQA